MGQEINTKGIGERGRRALLQLAESIPPLPAAVARLQGMVQEAQIDPAEVSEAISLDPILTGKLLQMVNSPLFALRREIESLHEAVVLIGLRPLRNIALAYSVTRWPRVKLSCYDMDQRDLWAHGWIVGSCARTLNGLAGRDRDDGEALFLAGLMHDLGKTLLAPGLNGLQAKVRHYPGTTSEFETTMLGIDHPRVGALVCAHWGLSQTVQELVTQHHDTDTAAPADYRLDLALLRLAEAVVHETDLGGAAPTEAIYAPGDIALVEPLLDSWPDSRESLMTQAHEAAAHFDRLLG